RHNEISHEQHTLVWQFNEQGIGRLPSLYGNKPNSRSADIHLGGMVDQNIRLETAQVIHFEALAEEMSAEIAWGIEFFGQFLLVIASGVKALFRIQATKIGMTANMIPVSVRKKDSREFRQAGRLRSQSLIGGLGRIGPRAGVNSDELSPVFG